MVRRGGVRGRRIRFQVLALVFAILLGVSADAQDAAEPSPTEVNRQRLERARELEREAGELMSRQNLREAEACLLEALDLRQRVHGRRHPVLAPALKNLGALYRRMQRSNTSLEGLWAAVSLFRRAAALLDSGRGAGRDKLLADIRIGLGEIYSGWGDPGVGAIEYERAFRLLEKHYEAGHPKLIDTLEKALDCLDRPRSSQELVRCCEACADHLERQLAKAGKRLGPDDPSVGKLLGLLALALGSDEASLPRVRECHFRALAIKKAHLEPNDMRLGKAHLFLARFLLSIGEGDGFWEHYKAALAIWKANGKSDLPEDLVALSKGNSYPLDYSWLWGAVPLLEAVKAYEAAKAKSGAESQSALTAGSQCLEQVLERLTGRDYPILEQLALEGVELSGKHHGRGSLECAGAYIRLARVRVGRGRASEAEAPIRSSLRIRQTRLPKRNPLVADAHAGLGYILCALGRLDESVKHYERAVAIRDGKKGPEDSTALFTRINLTVVTMAAEKYDAAHRSLDVILEALRKNEALRTALTPGSGDRLGLSCRGLLATVCRKLGRSRAERYVMGDAAGGPDRDEIYFALLEGDFRTALRLAREKTGIGRRIQTAKAPLNPLEWLKKSEAMLAVGAYEEAFADLLDAVEWLQVTAPALGTAQRNSAVLLTGPALGMLAEAVLHRGLAEEACAFAAQGSHIHHAGAHSFMKGVSGRRAIGGKDPAGCFTGAMIYLFDYHLRDIEPRIPEIHARALLATGRIDRALRVLEDALTDLERKLPPNHPRLASTLAPLARVHLAVGSSDTARYLAGQALKLLEKAFGKNHPDLCDPLLTLGDADVLTGNYKAAEKRYERVLKISRKSLIETHLNFPVALAGIAVARAKDERAREGVPPMREALALMGTRARTLFHGATATERIGLMASVHWALANWLLVTRAANLDGYEEVLRYKGLVGRAMGVEQRLYRGAGGEVKKLYDVLRREERSLARLAYAVPRPGWSRLHWRRSVAEAAERCAKLSRSLAGAYGAYGSGRKRLDLDGKAIAARLEKGEVLVDVLLQGDRYVAWVLSARAAPVRVELGAAEELDPLLLGFREAVLKAESTADNRYRDAGVRLRKRLWAPLTAAFPEDVSTVYLVPDGGVCATPLGALPATGDGAVLLDEYLLVLLTSAQQLVPWRPRPSPGRGAVVVGGVNFNATDRPQLEGVTGARTLAERVPGSRRFEALPGSKEEADFVKRLLKGASSGRVTHLMGEKATEHALGEAVAGSRIVHLATHGFVKKDMNGALRLPHGEQFRLRAGLELHAQRFDPLLLTGLALSGANVRCMENEDDGILTALEAMGLSLDGVGLVVLSACETAGGIRQSGEGVVGLVRGFTLGGAESVVASLWPVADDATRVLMERFYHHLTDGGAGSAAEALRRASRDLREGKRYMDPRHWSAFVAYGPGRMR